mgnify:CR=1 FL=1
MQMEKELNHVPRREIDRSVEVLHFVAGEDSSRRVLSGSGAHSTERTAQRSFFRDPNRRLRENALKHSVNAPAGAALARRRRRVRGLWV